MTPVTHVPASVAKSFCGLRLIYSVPTTYRYGRATCPKCLEAFKEQRNANFV